MSKILVADSGSSKTDWLLTDKTTPVSFKTSGLNPYFLNEKEMVKVIQNQAADMITQGSEVTEIYFYGAGCSSPDRHEIVSNALSQLFPKAFISVDSDLLGSAYATCGSRQGLCCVLGTGSNISFFDGEDIHAGKHGLGFVLGDEGSGTWFGKRLITDYLYGRMPDEVAVRFKNAYPLTKDDVINRVYMQPNGNSYLASFARFLSEIKATAYGANLIRSGLLEFVETNIKSYPEYQQYQCNFVGSIAWHFAEELKALCAEQQIPVGKIIRQPVHDLLQYILSKN